MKKLLILLVLLVILAAAYIGLFHKPEEPEEIIEIVYQDILQFLRKIDPVISEDVEIIYDEEGNWVETRVHNIDYMNQTDSRWANKEVNGYTISHSGCTPTVGAMLLNHLTGSDYTPYDVAVQFYEWKYMNIYWAGSDPRVWRKVADEYNLRYYDSLGEDEIRTALKYGWILIASVQGPPFTREVNLGDDWVSHTVLVYGLNSDNKTHVLDPYYMGNCGEYDLTDFCSKLVRQYSMFRGGSIRAFAPAE